MIQQEQNTPISQAMGLVSKRENELENLKKAVFRYWDRFEGGINDTFLKVFPFQDSMIDSMIIHKWLLEWNGGMDVVVSKLRGLVGKEINITDPIDSDVNLNYGSYDFDFKIVDIKHINKDEFNPSVFVDVEVDGQGNLSMIFNEPENQSPMTINRALETEDAYEVRSEIRDLIDEWLLLSFEDKNGVRIHINKVYID